MTRLAIVALNAVGWCFWKLGYWRAVAIGRALGAFVGGVLRVRRRVVDDNLAHAFPEKSKAERDAIARDTYRQLGRVVVEIAIMPRLTDAELKSLVRIVNAGRFEAALAEENGVIGCIAHLGNWELFGFATATAGYRVHPITKRLKGPLNDALHAIRRHRYPELPSKGSFDAAIEVLAKGGTVGNVIDQHYASSKAVVIEFFGRRAAATPAPALFALRSGRPVFTAWMCKGADDRYEIHFDGPHAVPDAPTTEDRLQRHSQLLATHLEAFVRERPAEWFWVHRRWKL